jgi:hypothetical protein
MKMTPGNQTVENAIHEIQSLAEKLDSTNTNKLAADLWNLDSKANVLRSLILNKVIRTA